MQTTNILLLSLIVSAFAINIPSDTIFATPGTLYTIPNDTLQLGSLNVQTGKINAFGPVYNNYIVSEQLTALDYTNQLLYAIVEDATNGSVVLAALDLTSGALSNAIVLPFEESFFVGVGQGLDVDPATGDIFVFGRESPSGPHTLIRVTPNKRKFETITSFNGIDVLSGIAAYDPINKIFWSEMGEPSNIYYYGIDVTNGDLVWNVTYDEYDMETLAWDPATRLMYGFGIAGNATVCYQSLVTLDSKSGKFAQVATLPKYGLIYASESAIDWINRVLYAFLQPVNDDTAPFQLVGVNMKNGNVVSNPQVCVTDCPWTLEFFNKPWH